MPSNKPLAIRLTFAYSGPDIRLTGSDRLAMFVPPSDPLDALAPQSGFWVEVRDPQDKPIFRRLMHHPIQTEYEVFPAESGGSIIRTPRPTPTGVFSIVVPDLPDGQSLVFHGSPPSTEHRQLAAREIARFDLRDLAAHKGGRPS
jgi:hypothetical protein